MRVWNIRVNLDSGKVGKLNLGLRRYQYPFTGILSSHGAQFISNIEYEINCKQQKYPMPP